MLFSNSKSLIKSSSEDIENFSHTHLINLIKLLKNFLCIFDKNYNKNRMVTLEYNMDVFILSKLMEMNETEKGNFVYELLYSTYKIIKN